MNGDFHNRKAKFGEYGASKCALPSPSKFACLTWIGTLSMHMIAFLPAESVESDVMNSRIPSLLEPTWDSKWTKWLVLGLQVSRASTHYFSTSVCQNHRARIYSFSMVKTGCRTKNVRCSCKMDFALWHSLSTLMRIFSFCILSLYH